MAVEKTIKTGWLKDSHNNYFCPHTYIDSIYTSQTEEKDDNTQGKSLNLTEYLIDNYIRFSSIKGAPEDTSIKHYLIGYNQDKKSLTNTVVYLQNGKLYWEGYTNDYVEFREGKNEFIPGYCLISSDKGEFQYSTKRLQSYEGVVSDTFGIGIGKTKTTNIPLAVSGRVLVYTLEDRNIFHNGDAVCTGPEGKVSLMTRDEIIQWPDRIVGIVSEIPDYKIWGEQQINVDNRIWIKVK